MLAVVALVLTWWKGPSSEWAFYLAVLLAGLSPLGFLGALLSRRRYGGALSDPNGIPPVLLAWRGRRISVDLNSVAVFAALLTLVVILVLFRF